MKSGPGTIEYLSRSSLALQLLIFFNGVYQILFFLGTLGLFTWKAVTLPYPDTKLGLEFFLVFAYEFLEAIRLFTGSRGNKIEHIPSLLAFIVLSLFGMLANIYLGWLQVYV